MWMCIMTNQPTKTSPLFFIWPVNHFNLHNHVTKLDKIKPYKCYSKVLIALLDGKFNYIPAHYYYY